MHRKRQSRRKVTGPVWCGINYEAITVPEAGITAINHRTHVLIAYQGMVDLEYLREVKRGASDGAIPIYRTRYSASDKLLELLGPMAPHEIAANLTVPPNEDPIRVQSKEKHRIEGKAEPAETKVRVEYQETALTTRMRRDIGIINDLLERRLQPKAGEGHLAGVDWNNQLTFPQTSCPCFYRHTFKTGGRFTVDGATLPSKMRAAIKIDGDDVVECDYGTCIR